MNHLSVAFDLPPGEPVLLSPRQQQIAALLLQGCENAEIARVLKMNRRTVKAYFNRLFLRFGISDGIKRVKLATLLYRHQLTLEANAVGEDERQKGRETQVRIEAEAARIEPLHHGHHRTAR